MVDHIETRLRQSLHVLQSRILPTQVVIHPVDPLSDRAQWSNRFLHSGLPCRHVQELDVRWRSGANDVARLSQHRHVMPSIRQGSGPVPTIAELAALVGKALV